MNSLRSTTDRSLPEWIERAYECLAERIPEETRGLTYDRAEQLLLGATDLPDEPADVSYALERLLEYGWLYEVENELRITDPEDQFQ